MSYENTQTMMSGYRIVDTNSPKGHEISMSGIQRTTLNHQDVDLVIYIAISDIGLKNLMIRNSFSMATWHSTQQVTELPILFNERSPPQPVSAAPSHVDSFPTTAC